MTQVFISYSRKDLAFVERLAEDLQAAGLEVWYDLFGLEGGTRWGQEIQNAIEASQCFVVVLSTNSIDSEWVEKEFMYANSLKKKIIPLLYQPCKTPMWFINLHFIDVQGENYDRNFWVILKAMGAKPGEGRAKAKPASSVPVTPAPLPQEHAAEEKARQDELARLKSVAEEKSRLEAEERLRQQEEIQVRRTALELERSRQEQQQRELRAAEIARLQEEIETALAGEYWEGVRVLISQLKEQGAEGRALAGSLQRRLPRKRIPGWVWAVPVVLVVIALLAVWGMPALAARLAITPAVTATHTPTFAPTATTTQTPTSTTTPTRTLLPSPTLAPRTTTDLNTGTVSSVVWWNSKPLAGVLVTLCSDWLYTCKGIKFTGVSDADGNIIIRGITPGEYQVITKYPGQTDETRLNGTAGWPVYVKVLTGEIVNVDPIQVCKMDLFIYSPTISNGTSVTFSWRPYPRAAEYLLQLNGNNGSVWWSTSNTISFKILQSGNYQLIISVGNPCVRGIVNFTVP
jgi:hypothetical protein